MTTLLPLLVLLAQANPKTPDLYYDAKLGVSINKPAKKEEWEFKPSGVRITNANLAVANRVENVAVEVFVIDLPANQSKLNSGEVKANVEKEYDTQSKSENFTSVTKKKLAEQALPFNAAGGVKAWHLEMAVKDKNGAEFEWRLWTFQSKDSKCLIKVNIITDPGAYEKHKKDLEYILGSLRTYKQAKS